MTDRRLYELINPSDTITFFATPTEAAFIANRMAAGFYFVRDCESDERPAEIDDALRASYDALWSDPERLASYSRAYASFLVCTARERPLFEDAITRMSEADADAYRKVWQETHRTSMNDIVAQCWATAKKIAAYQPEGVANG